MSSIASINAAKMFSSFLRDTLIIFCCFTLAGELAFVLKSVI